MDECRFCKKLGVYQVTSLTKGKAATYWVCEAHAQEPEAVADGVILPPTCPLCGARMESGIAFGPVESSGDKRNWIAELLDCPECGHRMQAPRPGRNEGRSDIPPWFPIK